MVAPTFTPGPYRIIGPALEAKENMRMGLWALEVPDGPYVAGYLSYHDALLFQSAPDLLAIVIGQRDGMMRAADQLDYYGRVEDAIRMRRHGDELSAVINRAEGRS